MPADNRSPSVDQPPRAAAGRQAAAGLAAGVVAGAVGVTAGLGRWPLVTAAVVVQIVLVLAWLAVSAVPAAGPGVVILLAAVVTADVYAARAGELDRVAGVVAAAFVAALVTQLARRGRTRVTESLAGLATGVVFVVLLAYLPATRLGEGGETAVVLVGFAVGAALLSARLVDAVVPRPTVGAVQGHGWPGLVAGLTVATALGMVIGGRDRPLTTASGALMAAACALTALLVELAVARAFAERETDRDWSAVLLLSAVLPLAAAAPVGYAVTSLAVR